MNHTRIVLILALGGIIFSGGHAFAATFYVDATVSPGGDGLIWCTAKQFIHDALPLAVGPSDEIRVADGIYYPDTGGTQVDNDRTMTLDLQNDVAIKGGYAGCGGAGGGDFRDFIIHETTLSGDINQSGDFAGNSYNVVRSTGTMSSAVIEGFTIRDGRADGVPFPLDVGGGMNNNGGSPTVTSCKIIGNRSTGDGGGMFNNQASPTVTDCEFRDNQANLDGGGLFNNDNSNGTFISCLFISNRAVDDGGGVRNFFPARRSRTADSKPTQPTDRLLPPPEPCSISTRVPQYADRRSRVIQQRTAPARYLMKGTAIRRSRTVFSLQTQAISAERSRIWTIAAPPL